MQNLNKNQTVGKYVCVCIFNKLQLQIPILVPIMINARMTTAQMQNDSEDDDDGGGERMTHLQKEFVKSAFTLK